MEGEGGEGCWEVGYGKREIGEWGRCWCGFYIVQVIKGENAKLNAKLTWHDYRTSKVPISQCAIT